MTLHYNPIQFRVPHSHILNYDLSKIAYKSIMRLVYDNSDGLRNILRHNNGYFEDLTEINRMHRRPYLITIDMHIVGYDRRLELLNKQNERSRKADPISNMPIGMESYE